MADGQLADRGQDLEQGLTEALAAMDGDQHLVGGLLRGQSARDPLQRVDDGIARDQNSLRRVAFVEQRLLRPLGRSEEEIRHHVDDPTVRLLRKRRLEISGAQPSLDVADAKPQMESRERGHHRRSCVALDQGPIGQGLAQKSMELGEPSRRQVVEGLVGPHQVQIVVGPNGEEALEIG